MDDVRTECLDLRHESSSWEQSAKPARNLESIFPDYAPSEPIGVGEDTQIDVVDSRQSRGQVGCVISDSAPPRWKCGYPQHFHRIAPRADSRRKVHLNVARIKYPGGLDFIECFPDRRAVVGQTQVRITVRNEMVV